MRNSPRRMPPRFFNLEVQQHVRKLHNVDQWSKPAIAAEIGCSLTTVYVLLKGIETPRPRRTRRGLPAGTVRRYNRGETVASIAARTGYRPSTLVRLLAAAGADVTADAEEQVRADIVHRYTHRRESIRTIAAALGRSYGYVRLTLTTQNVELRPRGTRRPQRPPAEPQGTDPDQFFGVRNVNGVSGMVG